MELSKKHFVVYAFLLSACIVIVSSNAKLRDTEVCPRKCDCFPETGKVDCSHRKLYKIPRGIPKWTRQLLLTGNFINSITYGSLQHLRDLKELELSHNFISRLNAGMLRRLGSLRRLNLSYNKLSKMTRSPFRRLQNLEELELHLNKLQKLDIDTFKGLEKLVQLDLSNNHLQTLETGMFTHMTELTHLYVIGNKWHCDCQLKKFEKYIRSKHIEHGFVICDSPDVYEGQALKDVHGTGLCGPKTNILIATLFGSMIGVMTLIFTIFMCRKRAALNAVLEINSSGIPKPITPTKEELSDRSSVISVLSEDFSLPKNKPSVTFQKENEFINSYDDKSHLFEEQDSKLSFNNVVTATIETRNDVDNESSYHSLAPPPEYNSSGK